MKQVVGLELHHRAGGRADRQPVEPKRIALGDPVHGIERQEPGQRLLLAAMKHVALELGDDQRQPGDLGGEVAQLDPAEVGQGNVGTALGLAPAAIDLGLDLAHLLVGDDKEVARAAGRVEHPDFRHAVAQVQQLARVVARRLQLGAQVIEEERVQHFQDVRHAGVVHAEDRTLLLIRDGLDHRAEDVGVDARPVQIADVQQVGARDLGKPRHIGAAREEPAVDIGKPISPARDARGRPIGSLGVHGAEDFADHLMGVRAVLAAHLRDGFGEQLLGREDVRILGKKQKISRDMK